MSKTIQPLEWVDDLKLGDYALDNHTKEFLRFANIFIDAKIPLTERDLWPIVVDSASHIVFVPGLKKSKFDKTNNEFYDIILRYE